MCSSTKSRTGQVRGHVAESGAELGKCFVHHAAVRTTAADGFLATVASEGRFVFSAGYGVIVLAFRSTNVVAGAAFEAYLPAQKS